MKYVNLIVVFDENEEHILMCKRVNAPYEGLFNFVGGKVEPHEDHLKAAYRELFEETGITRNDIKLTHFMDYVYPIDSLTMNIYYGTLNKEITLIPEKHPLHWFSSEVNFMDKKFAGDGNTYHMVKLAQYYNAKK